MALFRFLISIVFIVSFFYSCQIEVDTDLNLENIGLISGYDALGENGKINVVIEIPSGTIEKWEVDKSTEKLAIEKINGDIRKVNYIGYPGNYGMIPRTILPKELGGDGDPLDVIVLGPPEEKGKVIQAELIGVLKLLDRGEQDDKLIAISENSNLGYIESLNDMNDEYPGISEILKIWFTNYKGPRKMDFRGFGNEVEAQKILQQSMKAYESQE